MSDIRHPGREAYEAFCLALGANANWDTLPERSKVAWFAVECRCAGIPQTALIRAETVKEIEASAHDPDRGAAHRDRMARIAAILGPNEPRGAPLRSHVKDPSPFAHIPIMPGTLDAGPRQSTIPAEMEHLDRPMMVGGAVLDPGDDDRYLRSRLAGGDPAAAPLFSHIIGFPSLHVWQKRVAAEVAMDQMTTIAVDMGEHPASGRYLVTEAALRMMEQGEVVELVREPGAYSIEAAPIGGRGTLPSDLADQVRATLDTMLADLKASPGVILGNLESEPMLKTITLSPEGRAYVDRAMASLAASLSAEEQPEPEKRGPAVTAEVARSMGTTFTGDSCDGCGSFAITRTGKCTTCQQCGRTGGCG